MNKFDVRLNSNDCITFTHSLDQILSEEHDDNTLFYDEKNASALLSLKHENEYKETQDIFDKDEETLQLREKNFANQNAEANKIVERKRTPNKEGIFDIFSEYKEYVGEIIDLDLNLGTFLGKFFDIKESIDQTTTFDIDQLENISDRDSIEIGRKFLMLVGKKRKIVTNKSGERKILGDQNFYRITLRPEEIVTPKQEKEINEISNRWRKLFAK